MDEILFHNQVFVGIMLRSNGGSVKDVVYPNTADNVQQNGVTSITSGNLTIVIYRAHGLVTVLI